MRIVISEFINPVTHSHPWRGPFRSPCAVHRAQTGDLPECRAPSPFRPPA